MGQKPKGFFRFQSMWLNRQDFRPLVELNWRMFTHHKGMYGLMFKLKRLKQALVVWNKEVFKNVQNNVAEAEKRMDAAELAYDNDPSPATLTQMNESQALLFRSLQEEEQFWQQKSGIKWLREGDANTEFFHKSLQSRRIKGKITRIQNAACTWLDTKEEIGDEAVHFFSNLLAEDLADSAEAREGLLINIPELITAEENHTLVTPVQMEEVRAAVFQLNKDSAPGIDGFSGLFFQTFWDLVGSDVFAAVLDFFTGTPIRKFMGTTLVTLLPKK